MHTFQTPGRATVVLRQGAGRTTVTAEDTQRTSVELVALNASGEDAITEAVVEQRGDTVVVDLPRHRRGLFRDGPAVEVTIVCPTGSTLDLSAESADLRALGSYTDVGITSGSGDIGLDTVTGSARLKSGSGTVTAGRVGEALVVGTGSGDVTVDHSGRSATLSVGSGDITIGDLAGEVTTKTGSGDVEVGRLDGTLQTKTGSGSLTVRRAESGSVRANGASGNITIGVEEGTAAWLDVSTLTGRVSQELGESDAPTDDQRRVEITAHTVSGNLRVHRS